MLFFIGGLFPKSMSASIIGNSKGSIQNAANVLQWAFVKGLDYNVGKVTILSLPFVGTFPKRYKRISVKKQCFSHFPGMLDIIIPFSTIPLLGLFSRYFSLRKIVLNRVRDGDTIVIYSIHTPFLLAALALKKKFSNVHLCLIVPDLPQYMSESNNSLYRLLKKIDFCIIKKTLKRIDSFVLLSDYMVTPLNVGERPWVRIEGICSSIPLKSYEKESMFTFCYTGTLDIRYGILNLLNAFSLLEDPNLRLWICGKGNAEKYIEKFISKDSRIKYFGQVSHENVLVLQQKATVLINPRTSEGEYTFFSFPSKTLEYLISGTPCIMHDLPSLPTEYKKYLYLADESVNGLAKIMYEVSLKTRGELDLLGSQARRFVDREKNPYVQVQSMIKMINK